MHVRREGEGGRVVAEPHLHLLRVQPAPLQDRRAGVAERVERRPGNTCPPRRRLSIRLRFDGSSGVPAREGKIGSASTGRLSAAYLNEWRAALPWWKRIVNEPSSARSST